MKQLTIDEAFELIERTHGECDQNTCQLGYALNNFYDHVAIDLWIASGNGCVKFNKKIKGFKQTELNRQYKMIQKESFECENCLSRIYGEKKYTWGCDNCGTDLKND